LDGRLDPRRRRQRQPPPDGLVVNYLGLADNLQSALRPYVIDRDDASSKPFENEKLDFGRY
jgi:type I site-specific restriction-modification system R (restriction) subunit